MLKQLRLQNIILIEQGVVPFGEGFNIITGETGSGKSAIMKGLSLVTGDRSDSGMIRKGCEVGIVEAQFEVEKYPGILSLLHGAGIDHEPGEDLIIKREISLSGKNRIFVNHQLIQLQLLKKIGSHLIQIVGQHANQQLFSLDYHREILDLFGRLTELVESFQASHKEENLIRQELNTLIAQESQRLREIDIYRRELEELEEAAIKEGEEEELFAEYTLLNNSQELAEKIHEMNQVLTGERNPLIPLLHRQKSVLDSIVRYDSSLSEPAAAIQAVLIELQEVSHTLQAYQSSITEDPARLSWVNDRLIVINRLKRKYGAATLGDIQIYQNQTRIKLAQLENADDRIGQLQLVLKGVEEKSNRLASELTLRREQASELLEESLTTHLRSLNMSKSHFIVKVASQKRTLWGDDKVEFFLQPNIGENQIALKDAASGGEIARVLLAIHTLMAGKNKTPTLVFDEVDANIGGETATVMGGKLREIGKQHQVICVTHFSQVATQAHHHLQISKEERAGRTVTQVACLDDRTQQKELARMMGGIHF